MASVSPLSLRGTNAAAQAREGYPRPAKPASRTQEVMGSPPVPPTRPPSIPARSPSNPQMWKPSVSPEEETIPPRTGSGLARRGSTIRSTGSGNIRPNIAEAIPEHEHESSERTKESEPPRKRDSHQSRPSDQPVFGPPTRPDSWSEPMLLYEEPNSSHSPPKPSSTSRTQEVMGPPPAPPTRPPSTRKPSYQTDDWDLYQSQRLRNQTSFDDRPFPSPYTPAPPASRPSPRPGADFYEYPRPRDYYPPYSAPLTPDSPYTGRQRSNTWRRATQPESPSTRRSTENDWSTMNREPSYGSKYPRAEDDSPLAYDDHRYHSFEYPSVKYDKYDSHQSSAIPIRQRNPSYNDDINGNGWKTSSASWGEPVIRLRTSRPREFDDYPTSRGYASFYDEEDDDYLDNPYSREYLDSSRYSRDYHRVRRSNFEREAANARTELFKDIRSRNGKARYLADPSSTEESSLSDEDSDDERSRIVTFAREKVPVMQKSLLITKKDSGSSTLDRSKRSKEELKQEERSRRDEEERKQVEEAARREAEINQNARELAEQMERVREEARRIEEEERRQREEEEARLREEEQQERGREEEENCKRMEEEERQRKEKEAIREGDELKKPGGDEHNHTERAELFGEGEALVRRKEEGIFSNGEELRRNEDVFNKKVEDWEQKVLEVKREEEQQARRKEEDWRRKDRDLKEREKEAERKELELKRKEEEVRRREEELREGISRLQEEKKEARNFEEELQKESKRNEDERTKARRTEEELQKREEGVKRLEREIVARYNQQQAELRKREEEVRHQEKLLWEEEAKRKEVAGKGEERPLHKPGEHNVKLPDEVEKGKSLRQSDERAHGDAEQTQMGETWSRTQSERAEQKRGGIFQQTNDQQRTNTPGSMKGPSLYYPPSSTPRSCASPRFSIFSAQNSIVSYATTFEQKDSMAGWQRRQEELYQKQQEQFWQAQERLDTLNQPRGVKWVPNQNTTEKARNQ